MFQEVPHILVVDDDDRLRDLLQKYLNENGFRVTAAENAQVARAKMASISFDLLVLDLMMPGEHGLDFASSIREGALVGKDVPILMLTAMGETDDRITGLETGADDYMAKPFEPRELLLRIKSVLKRVPAESESVPKEAVMGDLRFDMARAELKQGEASIALTSGEENLLRILAEMPGRTLSREELSARLAMDGGERASDVQVNRLRRKIERDPKSPRYLQTVRGQGYILRPD